MATSGTPAVGKGHVSWDEFNLKMSQTREQLDRTAHNLSTSIHTRPQSTPDAKQGTNTKPASIIPKVEDTDGAQGQGHHSILYDSSVLRPRFPIFSGDDKSDVTFDVWKFEVKCAIREGTCSNAWIAQSIRSSLRGKARSLLLTLPGIATPDQIIWKLEGVYGNIYPSEQLIQQFYAAKQEPKESVAEYGMRLEGLLQTCIDRGDISSGVRNDMLRSKLWSGLRDANLRNASRFKYDAITDFETLRMELRTIELDMNNANAASDTSASASGTSKDTKNVSQIGDRSDKRFDTILQKLDSLNKRISDIEKKVTPSDSPLSAPSQPYTDEHRGRGGYSRGARGGSNSRVGDESRGGYRGYSDGFEGGSGGGYHRPRGGFHSGPRGRSQGGPRGRFRGGSRGGYGSSGGFRDSDRSSYGYGSYSQYPDNLNWY